MSERNGELINSFINTLVELGTKITNLANDSSETFDTIMKTSLNDNGGDISSALDKTKNLINQLSNTWEAEKNSIVDGLVQMNAEYDKTHSQISESVSA